MTSEPILTRIRVTGTVELAEWPEVNAVVGLVVDPPGGVGDPESYFIENTGKGRDLTSYLGEEVTVVGLLRRVAGGAAVLQVSRYFVPSVDTHGLDTHPVWRHSGHRRSSEP